MSKPLELNPRMLSSLVCASALLSACGGGATPSDFASALSAAPSTSATALEVTSGLPNAQVATAAQDLGPIAMAPPPPASDDRPPEATAVEADQSLPTVTTEAITASTLSVPLSLPPSTVETNSAATGLPPAPAPAPPAPAPPPGSYKILAGSGLAGVSATNCTPKLANDFVDATFWHLRRLQPRDCDLVKINPPAFTWTLPRDRDAATPWKLVLRKAGGSTVATQTTDEPRLALTGGELAAGDYEWTVSYVTTGKVTQTSEVRRFTIATDAQPMVLPTGDALAAAVSRKPHPRVLPAGTSFAAIAAMASTGEYKPAYVNLMARANTSKTLGLPPAPDQLSKVPGLGTLLGQAMDEQKNIEALGFAARFSGDKSYQTAGIARLLNLATWSPSGATSEASQDQINRAIYLALAQGLDLFGSDMSSAQRSAVAAPLKDRLGQAIVKFKDFDSYPYQSHLVSATNFVLEALLHVAGLAEFAQSNQMLAKAWDTYVFEFNSWGYEDGGFGNGVAYSWFNLQQVPRTLAAIKIIGGVDLAKHPYMARFGDSHIAMTAPMSKLISPFGDSSETLTLFPAITRDEYRLYAALTRPAARVVLALVCVQPHQPRLHQPVALHGAGCLSGAGDRRGSRLGLMGFTGCRPRGDALEDLGSPALQRLLPVQSVWQLQPFAGRPEQLHAGLTRPERFGECGLLPVLQLSAPFDGRPRNALQECFDI